MGIIRSESGDLSKAIHIFSSFRKGHEADISNPNPIQDKTNIGCIENTYQKTSYTSKDNK